MSFGDYKQALKMRDVVERIVKNTLDRERPRHRYATVATIDRDNRKATVTFPGDSNPVTVTMGSIQPRSAGQVVRIAGIGNDRFIDDVMGPTEPDLVTTYVNRAQATLSGADAYVVTAAFEISWAKRIMVMAQGRTGNEFPSGFFQVDVPPVGTVIKSAGGSVTDVTVNANGIPLAAWTALYYILPIGRGSGSLPENFRVVNFTAYTTVPSDWVLIAFRNNDTNSVKFGTGQDVPLGSVWHVGRGEFVPPGVIWDYGGTTAPTGWLMANGAFVSQTTYANLFAVYQHRYNDNVDPGNGTFKLPDFRDKQAVGASGAKALGSTGGAADALIGAAHLPAHDHDMAHTHGMAHDHDMTHTHGIPRGDVAGGSANKSVQSNVSSTPDATSTGSSSSRTGGSSAASTGGSSAAKTGQAYTGAQSKLPTQDPYVAVNKIVKY